MDVAGQPVAGSRREGFKDPLQRPDAPQWRAGGITDSVGDKSKSARARGTTSVVALNQTRAHKEDL